MKSKGMERFRCEQLLHTEREASYGNLIRCVLDTNSFSEDIKLKVSGYLRSKRYDLLLELADSLGRTEYPTATEHFVANQLAALIKKYPFKIAHLGVDPEAAALKKFHQAERLAGRYNLVFRLERKLGYEREWGLRMRMRRWIRKVIGEQPNYERIWPLCGFGPGASVGVSGNATHLARKFLEPRWSVTPSALPYALAALRSDPLVWELLLKTKERPLVCWDPDLFETELQKRVHMVTYNKITLVPKTAKVHRTIAVEPLLNGYVQKGIDEYLRRRLSRFGIDLKDQSRNQDKARMGSLPGHDPYATIDLSSASDLISLELAKDLLPPDWFALLNACRSPEYMLDGKLHRYHKFVSMGNGFCFPLETLIFASVCAAVYERNHLVPDFQVYGDDIIVRGSQFAEVLKLLRLIGFRHNPDKTFSTGPFRESCGADWFNGEDVRPINLDYELDSFSNIIKLHNLSLLKPRWEAFFRESRDLLRELVPPRWRFVRPCKGNVGGAFEVEQDLAMTSPHTSWNQKTWSWRWKEFAEESVSDDELSRENGWNTVLMMAALRGSASEAPFTKRRNTRTRVRLISHHGGSSTWLPSPKKDVNPSRFDRPTRQ